MGKYYSYGQRLDEAFKAARAEYNEAFDRLREAKEEVEKAGGYFEEKYIGERDARRARAAANLLEAQGKFKEVERHAWPAFAGTMNTLRGQLEKEIRADGLVSPDEIDNNGLELLKSGVMSPEDMAAFAEKYDSNATMLKLVNKYANEAAINAQDTRSKAGYNIVARATRNGYGKVLRQWDDICSVAKTCAGLTKGGSPEFIVRMANKWEELAGAAINDM